MLLRLLLTLMVVTGLALLARAFWRWLDAERAQALGIGFVALLLIGAGVAMLLAG